MHHRSNLNNGKIINQVVKEHPPKSGQHPLATAKKIGQNWCPETAPEEPHQAQPTDRPTCPQRPSTSALPRHGHPGNWPRIN